MTIQSDILRGFHPVQIMKSYGVSVAQLQQHVIQLAIVCGGAKRLRKLPPPPVRRGNWLTWHRRFRELRHFGV